VRAIKPAFLSVGTSFSTFILQNIKQRIHTLILLLTDQAHWLLLVTIGPPRSFKPAIIVNLFHFSTIPKPHLVKSTCHTQTHFLQLDNNFNNSRSATHSNPFKILECSA
jgi:hypothetical protein